MQMDFNIDEFNLLGGQTSTFQNFLNKDATCDLMKFMNNNTTQVQGIENLTGNINLTGNMSQIQHLSQENINLKQQLQEAMLQIQQLTQQVQNGLDQNQKLTQQLSTLKQQSTQQQQSNSPNVQSQIQNLNNVINQQNQQMREYDNSLNQLIVENEKQAQEIQKLKNELLMNKQQPQVLTANQSILNNSSSQANNSVAGKIIEQLSNQLNNFILENDIQFNQVDNSNILQFIEFMTQNTTYLLKKQNKQDQEINQLKLQNQRIREVCSQNLMLIRLRIEQLFNIRLNVVDFECVQLIKLNGDQMLEFREFNNQLRLINCNYLSREQCTQMQVGQIIQQFIFG